MSVDIAGPIVICDESATYTANIGSPGPGVPGVGPYNILWGVCAREIPTTDYPMMPLGSANPLTFNSGDMPMPEFWLFVSVISADGVFMNDIIRVDNPCENAGGNIAGIVSFSDPKKIQLTPNPVNQLLHLQFIGQVKDALVNYSISNSLGQMVLNGVEKMGLQNGLDIDLGSRSLPDGLYYLRLDYDGCFDTQKFIHHQ